MILVVLPDPMAVNANLVSRQRGSYNGDSVVKLRFPVWVTGTGSQCIEVSEHVSGIQAILEHRIMGTSQALVLKSKGRENQS